MKKEFKAGDELVCPRCGYKWESRKLKPRVCPYCKRHLFDPEGKPKPWTQVE